MLRYLAITGRPDRCVIVATHDQVIVGEARFHRLGGSDSAEVAVVIADDWQGRGLGTVLVGRLGELAAARGVSAFTGSMRAANLAAIRLLASLAPDADRRIRSGEFGFRAELPRQRRTVSVGRSGGSRPGATSSLSIRPRTPQRQGTR
jgi:RimJ/RimL family protein N-acetyltransferase